MVVKIFGVRVRVGLTKFFLLGRIFWIVRSLIFCRIVSLRKFDFDAKASLVQSRIQEILMKSKIKLLYLMNFHSLQLNL
jgi:hypothetical protein